METRKQSLNRSRQKGKKKKEGEKLHQHQMIGKEENTNKIKHVELSFSLMKNYFYH